MRLADAYAAFLLDLDGVLYRGDEVIPGAPGAVSALRDAGRRTVFLTNNSARTPQQVAEGLRGMGFPASPRDVVTSAQATARLVAREASDGRPPTAFVLGEEGIRAALAEVGIEVIDGEPEAAGFVVVGWDRGATYDRIRTASVLVRRGARFVATNADATYPAPGGEQWPGAGALVAAVQTAVGRPATVVGKPRAGLFETALEVAESARALVVGDRLETDVAGAAAAGLDAVLVRTGAASLADLLDHPAQPLAVVADVTGLLDERPRARVRPAGPADGEAVRALVEGAGLDVAEVGSLEGTVVVGDGAPVATASVDVRGTEAYVRSVAVAEEARGRSLGALVVAGAVRRAAAAGVTDLYLLTEDAAGFFEALGFEATARGHLPTWVVERSRGCSASATAMRRVLS